MKINKKLVALFVLMAVTIFASNMSVFAVNESILNKANTIKDAGISETYFGQESSNTDNSNIDDSEDEEEEKLCTEHEYEWERFTEDSKYKHRQKCKNCSYVSTTSGFCSYNDEIKSGETQHYNHCNTCGRNWNYIDHSYENKYDDDYHWQKCSCGYEINKNKHILIYYNNGSEEGHEYRCSTEWCYYHDNKKGDIVSHVYNKTKGDIHECMHCSFVSQLYPHHGFSKGSTCDNPNCTAVLSKTLQGEVVGLPDKGDYYMVGSGHDDWEKDINTIELAVDLTPYKYQDSNELISLNMTLEAFEHSNYEGHVGAYYSHLSGNDRYETADIPKLTEVLESYVTSKYADWTGVWGRAWIDKGTTVLSATCDSDKVYRFTNLPEGHWHIKEYSFVDNTLYNVGKIYCKGGEHPPETEHEAYLSIGYRDNDGEKIPGAKKDVRNSVVFWKNGATGKSFSFKVDLETLDKLGWRYVGYKQGKGWTIPGDLGGYTINTAESGSISPGFGNQKHWIAFIFEPVKVTVKHVNADRKTEIITNKNCTYDLPKLITQTGHSCISLECTEKEITENGKVPGTVAEVHNNTSLNKYLWPGYILTEYSLKTVSGDVVKINGQVQEKTYELIKNYPIEDATTRIATPEDNITYEGKIPRELYQKTVQIPTNVDTRKKTTDKIGYKKDLVLEFVYTNVDVTVSHRDYKTLEIDSNGELIKDGEILDDLNGNDLAYVQTLNGHYFNVSSLITQGTHVLNQTNSQYDITGSIIRKVDITKKDEAIYEKSFELKQSDVISKEADSVTNLLYYMLSSNDITDASLMREINRIGNDIEFKFYYEKVPMLTIKHQNELGNKLWPDEYVPLITDPTETKSKDLTRWSYVYKEYLLDNVSGAQGAPSQENPNSDVRKVNVPLNGTSDRVLVYIYKQDLPKLTVEYIDEAGNKIAADTEYTMDKDSVTTSAKDLSGLKDAAGNSYEYRDYKLYEGNTTSTPLESNGTNVSVTVNNTGTDRLLQFIYKVKENAGGIDSSQITSESIILKSNYRDTDEEYNVLKAIPTSEDLYANVITDSFLLSNVIKQTDKTEKIYVKLVQPYYMTNNTDDGNTGITVSDEAYAIESEGYVELDIPYSYFSARDVQLNIISRAVVKNGSIVVRDDADNVKEQGQVTLTPNYEKEPELYYVEGGNLVIKGLDETDPTNYSDMAGKTVKEYIDYLRTTGGSYDVQYNSFYNVEVKADGIYVEYVLPEIQYTEVTEDDMDAIVKRYKDNTYLLTKAAEENDVRVTMDTLKVIREDNSIITILSGAALPINREYTLIQLESQVDEHGNPLVDTTPDAPLISNNVLYKNTEIYVEEKSANVEYETTADVWYKPRQRVNPDTLTVETINNNDTFINSFPVYELSGTPGEILVEAKKNIPGNSVFVHTPVVNDAKIYENNSGIDNNQLIDAKSYTREQKKNILVLGHEFTIRIPNNGAHLNEKGYGNKAYNYKGLVSTGDTQVNNKYDSFASEREIRFTFGVIYNGTYYKVDEATGWTEWIKLGVNETIDFKFTAPEWEEELWKGTNHHTIETRVIAENATTPERLAKTQAKANTAKVNNEGNYVATKEIEVKLIGEMLDLEMRATNDVGWTQLTSSLGTAKFPIGQPGQNKITAYKYGLKLGTKVYFDITTTGWTGDTTESIQIKPEFYYASKDGSTVQKVDLYYKENAAGQYVSLDNKPVELGTVMSQDVIKGTQYVSRFAGKDGKQGTFAMDGGRELSTTYNLLKKYGKELVNYGQKISLNKMINLPYSTRLTYTKAIETLDEKYEMVLPNVDGTDYCIGHWYGAMRVPSTTIAVPEGGSQPKLPSDGLKDGYIIVRFEEVIGYKEGTAYLDYDPIRYDLEGGVDNNITLPNGEEVEVPGKGTPAIIYELVADKVDYENGMIY